MSEKIGITSPALPNTTVYAKTASGGVYDQPLMNPANGLQFHAQLEGGREAPLYVTREGKAAIEKMLANGGHIDPAKLGVIDRVRDFLGTSETTGVVVGE